MMMTLTSRRPGQLYVAKVGMVDLARVCFVVVVVVVVVVAFFSLSDGKSRVSRAEGAFLIWKRMNMARLCRVRW